MPNVNGKKFPNTKKGIAAAKKAADEKKKPMKKKKKNRLKIMLPGVSVQK